MDPFTYSKLWHFEAFLADQRHGLGYPDDSRCDLKVYQDYLVYNFLLPRLKPGSRILEVGGGHSRVLDQFNAEHECWNVDKFVGLGNGPIRPRSKYFRTVYEYIGDFSDELPPNYFDCVFSISALEHTAEVEEVWERILVDITRVLIPGAPSFHCFDIRLHPERSWCNGIVPYLHKHAKVEALLIALDQIRDDRETWVMSEAAYDRGWKPRTGRSYAEFGKPASYNLMWNKPLD